MFGFRVGHACHWQERIIRRVPRPGSRRATSGDEGSVVSNGYFVRVDGECRKTHDVLRTIGRIRRSGVGANDILDGRVADSDAADGEGDVEPCRMSMLPVIGTSGKVDAGLRHALGGDRSGGEVRIGLSGVRPRSEAIRGGAV